MPGRQEPPRPAERQRLRLIFERYAELRSIAALVDELHQRGTRTKLRHYKDGSQRGGISFTKGPLALLLKNPVYIGKVRHRDALYEGEHDAIVDEQLWEQAQNIACVNGRDHKLGRKARNPSLLAGIITDPDGRAMSPTHTRREGRQYRYYISQLNPGDDKQGIWRVPAGEIERIVVDALVESLQNPGDVVNATAEEVVSDTDWRSALADTLLLDAVAEQRGILLDLGLKVQLGEETVTLSFDKFEARQITVPARLVRRGSDVRLALAPGENAGGEPDPVLLRLVAYARAAHQMVESGKPHPMVAHYGKRHFWQLLRIAWLAPDIISAIVEGRQPPDLTGRKLLRATNIPLDWAGQRQLLGFA